MNLVLLAMFLQQLNFFIYRRLGKVDDYAEFVNFKCLMYTGLMVYLGIPQMDTKQV